MSYEDILNKSADEISTPKTLPGGSWVLKATGPGRFMPPREEGKTPQVVFFYEATEPMSDVDDSELEALGSNYDYANNELSTRFYIEKEKDWARVMAHVRLHGVDTEGLTIKQALEAVKSARIVGAVTVGSYTDRNTGVPRAVNNLKQFQAVDA